MCNITTPKEKARLAFQGRRGPYRVYPQHFSYAFTLSRKPLTDWLLPEVPEICESRSASCWIDAGWGAAEVVDPVVVPLAVVPLAVVPDADCEAVPLVALELPESP